MVDASSIQSPRRAPFKQPGGKWKLVPQLLPFLPRPEQVTGWCREPFAGGGAVSLRWAAPAGLRIALSDTDPGVVDTLTAIADRLEELLDAARALCLPASDPPDRHAALYYRLRTRYNERDLVPLERAALFLYLHKTCFNGLHRVDSRGAFNASYGDLTGPPNFDEKNLRAVATALRGAWIERLDFEAAALRAEPGDVVYLDPPYDGLWAGYQAGGFEGTGGDDACQVGLFTRETERPPLLRLRDTCVELDRREVHWVMSNADTAEVRRLFARFHIATVVASTSISRSAASRGARVELVVTNRPPSG